MLPLPLGLAAGVLGGLLAAGGEEELGEGLWLEEEAGVEDAGVSLCSTGVEEAGGVEEEDPPLGLQREDVSRFLFAMLS